MAEREELLRPSQSQPCQVAAATTPQALLLPVVLNGYSTATRGTCCRPLLILRELRFSFMRFDPGGHLL